MLVALGGELATAPCMPTFVYWGRDEFHALERLLRVITTRNATRLEAFRGIWVIQYPTGLVIRLTGPCVNPNFRLAA